MRISLRMLFLLVALVAVWLWWLTLPRKKSVTIYVANEPTTDQYYDASAMEDRFYEQMALNPAMLGKPRSYMKRWAKLEFQSVEDRTCLRMTVYGSVRGPFVNKNHWARSWADTLDTAMPAMFDKPGVDVGHRLYWHYVAFITPHEVIINTKSQPIDPPFEHSELPWPLAFE